VSDEDNSLVRRPTFGSRRVPVLVGAPVIVGCALLGSIIGITHPLRSTVPDAQRREPSDLPVAVDKPEKAAQVAETEAVLRSGQAKNGSPGSDVALPTPTAPPSAVVAVDTGVVERPPAPIASEDIHSTHGDRPELAPSEGATRSASPSHRQAHAKRLRRILWRRARVKPSPGGQVGAFISSILPKN
jgi:hypothetical protein